MSNALIPTFPYIFNGSHHIIAPGSVVVYVGATPLGTAVVATYTADSVIEERVFPVRAEDLSGPIRSDTEFDIGGDGK